MAQNIIQKSPIATLGYQFVEEQFLPKGKDEYYLRNMQIRNGIHYRQLTAYEIEVLVRNRNTSDDWNKILVSDAFNPELVKNCKFYGLVRIGKLEPYCLGFSDLKMPVGLYNSTIISCDFGDNVVIDNVHYLSHYIIGSEVLIVNVNELATTNHAKFGNGILKDGEPESVRIWLGLCNENEGRKVMPFNGMLPGDAFLWSKYRDDELLLQKFKQFTEDKFDTRRGYYGKVGDRTVIKNTAIIKDVWIGSDAYIKGANKLKNITINSGEEGKSQIGEGCELVNGVVGFGCRIFYGAKAVRFIMADHSQLKYGARLINSYLGYNATISCCEVLNSLIFPGHEQHHNNSFLCASLVMGQSNIAAGATIGSNHNSRSADGEIIAGRGFWPGLCVSLKHNSKFASFTIIAKGDFPAELDIPLPFSLVSNDVTKDRLVVMPGYWFSYNMYALARNTWKYTDRDKRVEKLQYFEYDYLAPDTISEICQAILLLQHFTGLAWYRKDDAYADEAIPNIIKKGAELLDSKNPIVHTLEIIADGFENTKRKAVLIKVMEAYHQYKNQLLFYGVTHLVQHFQSGKYATLKEGLAAISTAKIKRTEWINIGGQLMPVAVVEALKAKIREGKIRSWDEVHNVYTKQSEMYETDKFYHALSCLELYTGKSIKRMDVQLMLELLAKSVDVKAEMVKAIYDSRAKDYTNRFRRMVYNNTAEMENVTGKLEENSFILLQQASLKQFKSDTQKLKKRLSL
jgi:hypothetical protein